MNYESTLNDKQKEILDQFLASHKRDLDDFDCCMTANYYFEITPSGIGDCIWVVCGEDRVWLDDGLES